MKATKIYYKELRSFGDYNNKEIGIELEIQDGEKAQDAFHKAKLFVQACLASESVSAALLEDVVRRVRDAQNSITNFADRVQQSLPLEDEIPF